ncbi:MAG TPA: ATP-grasp domain-containing protein [Gaiellaceae bacterium]|nr:ATP-grasp domain-containing protein [Gaiellaceae bacterium]
MRALIVEDGFQRGSLAAARALGAAGWQIGIGSPREGFASSSRSTIAWHRVPSPEVDPEAFVAAVRKAVDAGGYDVVFGAGDGEVLALSAGRDELGAIFPYGPHEDVVRAFDKLELAAAAERAGLSVPAAARPEDAPVVVKPRRTTVHDPEGGPLRLRATIAQTPGEARAQVEYLESVGAEPLAQEFVDGDLVAYVAVTDRESRVISAVQQRTDAIWPTRSGGTVRARTEPVDGTLAERVAALLADLNWFGIAQAQFQQAPGRDPVLIDFNGRFYGSMALALSAGANLPAIWAALATDRPLPEVASPRDGVRYHWLESDLRRVVKERRGLVGSLGYAIGSRHGLWDRQDPRPAAVHVKRLAGRALRRASANGSKR